MNDTIERVARALARQDWHDKMIEPRPANAALGMDTVENGWRSYVGLARAAIDAVESIRALSPKETP